MRYPMSLLTIALILGVGSCGGDRSVQAVHGGAPRETADAAPSTGGTPLGEGTIRQMLAIDRERAVAVFTPYTRAGVPPPTLLLMHRDGGIGWSVPLDHTPLAGRRSTGIEIVGDAVSVAIAHAGEDDERLDRLEIYGLDDGRRRAVIRPEGEYYGRETIVDGGERYDLLTRTSGSLDLLIASDGQGERWRASIRGSPGDGIVALPEVVAIHVEESYRQGTWRVVSRGDGRVVGVVSGGKTCSDGQRWFVLDRDRLLEVDPKDLSTREAMPAPALPGPGETTLRDCTIISNRPVAFVQRGMLEALVAARRSDGAIEHVVSLGIRRRRQGAVGALPDRLHPIVATLSVNEDAMYELGVTDLRRGGTSLEGVPRTWLGVQGLLGFDHGGSGGYAVALRGLIAVVDGDSGELRGRHIRRDTMAMHRSQLAGTHLWLPPAEPMKLGRDAPTVLDLSQPSDDPEMAAAVGAALSEPRTIQCDTEGWARHDGFGTSERPGSVSHSRLPPWAPEHIAVSARGFACARPTATVVPLAWSVVEDDRPLQNHYVLALVEDVVDGAPLYTVVALYRHATNRAWNIATSYHDSRRPLRRFTSRPTTADLDAFIDQSHFELADSWGRVLVGNVIDPNWIAATGERPSRHFASGIEQLD